MEGIKVSFIYLKLPFIDLSVFLLGEYYKNPIEAHPSHLYLVEGLSMH